MRWRWVIGLLLLLLVAGAACTGSDDDIDEMALPLVELGLALNGIDSIAFNVELLARTDLAKADCMTEAGFEFDTRWDDLRWRAVEDQRVRLTDMEHAQQHGFGFFTIHLTEARAVGDPRLDPNSERVRALTAEDRDAYFVAWDGDGSGGVTGFFDGCQNAGQAAYGDWELWMQLVDAYQELRADYRSDASVVALASSFDECLAVHGVASSGGVIGLVETLFEFNLSAHPDEVRSLGNSPPPEQLYAMTDAELDDMFPPPNHDDILAAVQDFERRAAIAAVECGMDIRTGMTEESMPIRLEYERAFMAEHADLIAQFRASLP